ncbi:ABC transporter, CydDC cysteine exporter (CydDC-E) family, permease/ATP-binding protein CydC [Stackebrandtia soli]
MLRLISPHLPRIALAGLIGAGAELSGIALIATAAWLLATAASAPPLTALSVAIVAVRTFAISRGVLRYLDRLVGHDAVLRALAALRGRVFSAIAPLVPATSRVFGGPDLLNRLVTDVDAIQDLVLRVFTPIWTAVVVGAATLTFVAFFSPPAAAVAACGLLLAGVALPVVASRTADRAARDTAVHRGALAASAVDLVRGERDLAAYGATEIAAQRASADADALADAERRGAASATVTTALGTLVAGVTVIAVALTAPDLGVMTAVLALTVLVAFESVAVLPAAAKRLVDIRASARRLVDILDLPPTVPDPAEPLPLPTDPTLRLRGARPAIGGRVDAGATVDLDLPPGRRVAIVGPSGGGKTMLLSMLTRFVPIGSGTVTLGGVDMDRLTGDDVRTVIGGMTADAHVFAVTIRDNLRVAAPEADDDRLAAALAAAGLPDWADRLDLWPGDDGAELSGGQRQRLLLARALLADHAVLVLDEPTEHLDDATADAVTRDLLAATEGRSLLLVTHRLRGLDQLDEIVVLDDGRVVERGTHDQLMDRGGYYHQAQPQSTIDRTGSAI